MRVKVISNPKPGQRRGDWEVRKGRSVVSTHRKKSTAVTKARSVARGAGATLVVQNQDGTLATKASY